MSAPVPPTLVALVTEALRKAGYSNPTAQSCYTRAQSTWIEEIKADIWEAMKKPKCLQTEAIIITTNGLSQYDLPTDFSSDLSMSVMDGTVYGSATAGSTSTVTIDATTVEADIIGKEILIYSGTGLKQYRQCVAYDAATKQATVSPVWTTAPDNTSKYMIIDVHWPITSEMVWNLDARTMPTLKDIPQMAYYLWNAGKGQFILFPTPYRLPAIPWGIKIRYYANLQTLDTTGTLMLNLYQRWRSIWTQGLYAKALDDMDDDRKTTEMTVYYNRIRGLVAREMYGVDDGPLRCVVQDY